MTKPAPSGDFPSLGAVLYDIGWVLAAILGIAFFLSIAAG